MKQTINFTDFHDAFRSCDRLENFSYDGSKALYEWLETLEEDTGTEYELDVIALCCEFNEDSIESVLAQYKLDSLEDLQSETSVIWHDDENVLYAVY